MVLPRTVQRVLLKIDDDDVVPQLLQAEWIITTSHLCRGFWSPFMPLLLQWCLG